MDHGPWIFIFWFANVAVLVFVQGSHCCKRSIDLEACGWEGREPHRNHYKATCWPAALLGMCTGEWSDKLFQCFQEGLEGFGRFIQCLCTSTAGLQVQCCDEEIVFCLLSVVLSFCWVIQIQKHQLVSFSFPVKEIVGSGHWAGEIHFGWESSFGQCLWPYSCHEQGRGCHAEGRDAWYRQMGWNLHGGWRDWAPWQEGGPHSRAVQCDWKFGGCESFIGETIHSASASNSSAWHLFGGTVDCRQLWSHLGNIHLQLWRGEGLSLWEDLFPLHDRRHIPVLVSVIFVCSLFAALILAGQETFKKLLISNEKKHGTVFFVEFLWQLCHMTPCSFGWPELPQELPAGCAFADLSSWESRPCFPYFFKEWHGKGARSLAHSPSAPCSSSQVEWWDAGQASYHQVCEGPASRSWGYDLWGSGKNVQAPDLREGHPWGSEPHLSVPSLARESSGQSFTNGPFPSPCRKVWGRNLEQFHPSRDGVTSEKLACLCEACKLEDGFHEGHGPWDCWEGRGLQPAVWEGDVGMVGREAGLLCEAFWGAVKVQAGFHVCVQLGFESGIIYKECYNFWVYFWKSG